MSAEPKLSLLVEYSKEAAFHGIKYIFKTNLCIFERLFWIVILTTLNFILGFFVYTNVSRFIQFPLKIQDNTHTTQVFEIPFPAVTICPANKIQNVDFSQSAINEHFMKYINNYETDAWHSNYGLMLIMATQVCRKKFSDFLPKLINHLSKNTSFKLTAPTELNHDELDSLYEMWPTLYETIFESQFSNWYDKKLADADSYYNVRKLFSDIYTNDGLCYTFNTIPDIMRSKTDRRLPFLKQSSYIRDGWDPETGYSKHKAYPFKGMVRGNKDFNGLSVQMTRNFSRRREYCLPSNLGYKVLLHAPSAYPNTYEKFISLEYGKEYTIAVKPETISTANTLRSLSYDIRQCYFNDERQLKYYTFYNENNCKLECYANFTLKMFGGFPFSAPRDRNVPITILKSHNYGWYLPNYINSIRAYNKIYKDSVNFNSTLNTDCNCLPECNLIRYDYEIVDKNVNPLELNQVKYSNNISDTGLEIIFQQPSFIGKQRVEEYTFSTLLSEFGGLLGLFMGGSIISIFELIYFLMIRNLCRAKQKKC